MKKRKNKTHKIVLKKQLSFVSFCLVLACLYMSGERGLYSLAAGLNEPTSANAPVASKADGSSGELSEGPMPEEDVTKNVSSDLSIDDATSSQNPESSSQNPEPQSQDSSSSLEGSSDSIAGYKEQISNSRDKISEYEKRREELKTQMNDLDATLEELASLKNDAAQYISSLDEKISEVDTKVAELNAQIEAVLAEMETTSLELEEAKNDEAQQYANMKLRIQYMYENGSSSLLNVLFGSGSLSELLNKAEYIANVSQYDRNKLNEFVDLTHAIEAKEEELELQQELLETSEEKLLEERSELETLQKEKQTEIENYNSSISGMEQDAQALSVDISEIQAAIQAEESAMRSAEERIRKEEEEARKKAEEAGETYTPKSIGDIYFSWPCPSSSRITSYFGDRESPTEGASTNHKGIDIGASSGSAVLAAAKGEVVISTYSTSAGNYIMLSHGGGIYSVYMHMQSMNVSVGEEVSGGQQIGTVGSTGYSTGPHLHFGIRVNGSYVNPLDYVQA